jgi:predicted GNAT superfamily acetyltransferase
MALATHIDIDRIPVSAAKLIERGRGLRRRLRARLEHHAPMRRRKHLTADVLVLTRKHGAEFREIAKSVEVGFVA